MSIKINGKEYELEEIDEVKAARGLLGLVPVKAEPKWEVKITHSGIKYNRVSGVKINFDPVIPKDQAQPIKQSIESLMTHIFEPSDTNWDWLKVKTERAIDSMRENN